MLVPNFSLFLMTSSEVSPVCWMFIDNECLSYDREREKWGWGRCSGRDMLFPLIDSYCFPLVGVQDAQDGLAEVFVLIRVTYGAEFPFVFGTVELSHNQGFLVFVLR